MKRKVVRYIPKGYVLGYVALSIAAIFLIGDTYIWQHDKVNDLQKQVVELQQHQMPSQQYTSYDTCVNNGGIELNTINGEFDECLEGNNQVIMQYSAQNLPRIDNDGTTTVANVVKYATGTSTDLVSYLTFDDEGCSIGQPSGTDTRGYYKVIREVPNRYALLNYGCMSDPDALKGDYYIIAMKLANGWVLLSPTNNMSNNGTPSCLLVDIFKISRSLSGQCFQNTGYDNGSLRAVTNQ